MKSENQDQRITVDVAGLMQLTGLGRDSATKIGKAAGAEIRIGRRVLFNVRKVRDYLDMISE